MNGIDKKNTIYIGIILVVLVITCAFSFTFAFVGGAQGKGVAPLYPLRFSAVF